MILKRIVCIMGLNIIWSSFKPNLSHAALNAPVLLIDRIATSKGVFPGNGGRIELPYASNFVQLNFDAVNFLNPEDNQFSYRISPKRLTLCLACAGAGSVAH